MSFSMNKIRRQPFTPSGQLLDIGGFRLHLHSRGPLTGNDNKANKHLPTVVIEAGCGWHSMMYYWLQEQLSPTLRVCSYDRAGLGWSEESHQPRDAEPIATQLHALLNQAGIEGPIILVGHSIAGLYLRVYANKYPDNIVGMVLLDASHPKQKDVLAVTGFTRRQRVDRWAMAVYAALGLAKLYPPDWELKANHCLFLPPESQRQLIYLLGFRQAYTTPLIEFDAFDLSAKQALAAGDLGDLPLLVITGPHADYATPNVAEWQRYADKWLSLQKDLVNLSSNSQHNVIDEAGHCTLITKQHFAEQVANEIHQFFNVH